MYWFHRTKQTLTQCIGFTKQTLTNVLVSQNKTTLTQCIGFTEQNKH